MVSDEWRQWGIPGEVLHQAIQRLPDDWSISIELRGGNVRPYVILHDDIGDCCIDSDGPNEGETLVDCVSRLVQSSERACAEMDLNGPFNRPTAPPAS